MSETHGNEVAPVDFLRWLADCQKNNAIATARNFPIDPAWLQTESLRSEAMHWGFTSIDLSYEPRSLAVSSEGWVAVGTKVGEVCLTWWDAEHQSWAKSTIPREEICGKTPRAIRGLAILDRSHLVAAWGGGRFSVVHFDPSGNWTVFPLPPDREPKDEGQVRADRFSRLVPLSAPDQPLPPTGDLILGICRGGALHLLRRCGECSYDRIRVRPEEILPVWEKDWGRLVDGVWMAGRLWLLSSQGVLVRYALGQPGRVDSLTAQGGMRLDPPHGNSVFRRVAACEAGLAVLAEESVTFLWRDWLDNLPETEPEPRKNPEPWFRVQGAMDCAATLPYPLLAIDRKNPVWVLVSTNGPGLRWIAWRKKSWPRAAPANFILAGGGSVLYVATGRPAAGAPPFVACGTRDQKLVVASILNRWTCDDEIAAQIRVNLLSEASPEDAKERLLAAGDGMRWWCLLQRLQRDFGSSRGPEAVDSLSVESLLGSADTSNLRSLASRLVICRTRSEAPEADAQLAEWVLRLLWRANQVDKGVDQEIAHLLYEKLQRWEESSRGGEQAGSLAAFLRKWVIYGHTFLEKSTGLLEVFNWNHKCERSLDALVYATRLLRQRTDLRWKVSPPPETASSTVWSLVTGAGDGFVISSLSDGTLCAVSGDGRRIPWAPPAGEARLRGHELRLTQDGLCLERIDREAFEKKYYHGPYTRILWLKSLDEGPGKGDHLLVFCPKGWRRQDKVGYSHSIYALRLRPAGSKEKEEDEERVDSLQIVDVDSHVTQGEIHALCEIEPKIEEASQTVVLVAGTSGSWHSEKGQKPRPRPFIEIQVELKPESLKITPVEVEVMRNEEGDRSVLREGAAVPETAYNPCWAVAPSRGGDGGTWIWAGFQDGYIRGYRRQPQDQAGEAVWMEGGGPRSSRGAQLTGAVWRLLEFEARGERLLAFGTGDGVVGAVRLADLTGTTMGEPILFPIHTRETTPICGLFDFSDWEDEADQPFLMAVTQGGVCCIFSLDFLWDIPKSANVNKDSSLSFSFHYPGLRGERFRLGQDVRAVAWIGKRRRDLDKEGEESRKESRDRDKERPEFLVGTAEGRVLRYQLALPRYSWRRRHQAGVMRELMLTSRKGLPVIGIVPPGPAADERAWCHRWLRALHVGESLLAYSVWEELRQAGEELWNEDLSTTEDEHAEHFCRFRLAIERIEPETYGRRPFSKESAKMLWTEVGRIAGALARRALQRRSTPAEADPLARRRLQSYLILNVTSSDLCNRWIGAEQALESTVLIHSFSSFFDWAAVVLIASDQEPVAEAEEAREFLVYTLIQRRLNFPDPIVPLETLRTINVAILRAIVNNCRDVIESRTFLIVPGRRQDAASESGSSFFAVMTMVGDLWERLAHSLPLSDPLVTEVLRFFSLSLLLVPESALLAGQVVSESRLTEGGTGLAELILDQARSIDKDLFDRSWKEDDAKRNSLRDGLRRFEAYIQVKVDFTLAEPLDLPEDADLDPKIEPWRFLAKLAREHRKRGHLEGKFTEESMLVEQYHVLEAAAWLSELHRKWSTDDDELGNWFKMEGEKEDLEQLRDEKYPEAIRWLLLPTIAPKFFRHSWLYLRKLTLARQDIRHLAGLTKVTSPGEGWVKFVSSHINKTEIEKAIYVCDVLIEELQEEYIFRPQRDHYEEVIRSWRDELVKRGREAITVLEVLDRFNRHVYRTSADNLMDRIVDLSLQVAPISFLEEIRHGEWRDAMEGPLRLLLAKRLAGYPLVRKVFESGEQLVERTHLAGALLAVAQDYVGKRDVLGKKSLTSPVISINEIKEMVDQAARRMGIADKDTVWLDDEDCERLMAPGSAAIWDLIAHESAVNVFKHARPEGSKMKARVQRCHDQVFVLIAAENAYAASLAKTMREESDMEREIELLEARFDDFMKGSTGMGLFMIERIAGMCGIATALKLFDPAKSVKGLMNLDRPISDKWSSPLCLCLSWRV